MIANSLPITAAVKIALTQTSSATELIHAEHIVWRTQNKIILDKVSLRIRQGEIVTVIGPNGAGKSTLVKVVCGLRAPQSGKIIRKPGLRIGYMPQRLHIDETLPLQVERFLSLGGHRIPAIDAVCDTMSLTNLRQVPITRLSGGELQRVMLARCVLRKPELLILDEPTQGVDVHGQTELYDLITEIRDRLQCGVLMISHDLHLVMAKTDTVVCLNHHVCCHGEPESVSQHPEYLQLFGPDTAQSIAVYTHAHDHEHDLHGDVVKGSET